MGTITLTIVMDETGNIQVNGPLTNKVLCYGLLELAKESVSEWHRTNARLVQPAAGPLPRIIS
jgi:hypothetical protein